jgi:hypothetical protein
MSKHFSAGILAVASLVAAVALTQTQAPTLLLWVVVGALLLAVLTVETATGKTRMLSLIGLGMFLFISIGIAYWFRPPRDDNTMAVLRTGPNSVAYDATAVRLTVVQNLQNAGDRHTVASITNAVWLDGARHTLNPDRSKPQPWRTELIPKEYTPVIFILEGSAASESVSGEMKMEVSIEAKYEARPGLTCVFMFRGVFERELAQLAMVDTVTTPSECLGR